MNRPSADSPLRVALRHYGAVVLLCTLFAALLHTGGNSPSLIGLKMAVVPLWYLSLGGLNALYRYPIVEPRWTARAIEHAVLRALLLGLFVASMQWTPEQSLSDFCLFAGLFSSAMTAFHLYELRRSIGRLRRDGVPMDA